MMRAAGWGAAQYDLSPVPSASTPLDANVSLAADGAPAR